MHDELKKIAKIALKIAIKDYVSALQKADIDIIHECSEFFNSEQFDLLTECAEMREMDSDYIMNLCRKKIEINDRKAD